MFFHLQHQLSSLTILAILALVNAQGIPLITTPSITDSWTSGSVETVSWPVIDPSNSTPVNISCTTSDSKGQVTAFDLGSGIPFSQGSYNGTVPNVQVLGSWVINLLPTGVQNGDSLAESQPFSIYPAATTPTNSSSVSAPGSSVYQQVPNLQKTTAIAITLTIFIIIGAVMKCLTDVRILW
jgi:hypothetical protein